MNVFLAGAGPDPVAFPDIFDRFAHDVRAHAGQGKAARIAVAVHYDGPNLQDLVAAYAEPLKARIDCGVTVVPLAEEPAGATAVDSLDAIVVGAVAAGLVERVVAIDEHTALVLDAAGSQDYEVIGNGNCWDVRQTGQAAVVSVRTAR
ncbi:MAG TPA: hypothetical protein VLJ40_09895 [Arthrobacter sp.]|nr:hypothetical protein [Arthrobacter sp.]